MFGILYLLMIRPQQKQQKELRQKLSSMSKGDKVITSGGIHGIVANIKDNIVVVRIAENVKIDVSRSHIADVLPKGDRTSDK
jgi:preprotein translocase subunit YajC